VFEAFAGFEARRQRRRDAFWDRIFDSRYGAFILVVITAVFFVLGLLLLFSTLDALSTGVIQVRRSRIYLAESPALFWMGFAWNLALSGLMVGGIAVGLWFRFGTARGKRTAAQRRRRARKKLSSSE